MKRRNVLVFPAGTEIGLEIYQALKHCKEVKLFGCGQDVLNHARFAYPEYYSIPSIYDVGWLECVIDLCHRFEIEYIFPAHDDIIVSLSRHREKIPAVVISPSLEISEITRSKSRTYRHLTGQVRVPVLYTSVDEVATFPVLVKPDQGQGSFGVRRVNNKAELISAVTSVSDAIICEYLPGEEYTVDCFSDRESGVLFTHARIRRRIRNGISVNTVTENLEDVPRLSRVIGRMLQLYGAWFFQVKCAIGGELTLLEVAPRISGSMATHRVMGVNFPLLSIFEQERLPLSILINQGKVEMDRALNNRYRHDVRFGTLYVDLDDTLLVNDQVNTQLARLIFQCINEDKKIKLITRHRGDLSDILSKHRISNLFDEVIHLTEGQAKSEYIFEPDAIFIDDSFSERQDVAKKCRIPTFDSSMIELLTEQASFLNEG